MDTATPSLASPTVTPTTPVATASPTLIPTTSICSPLQDHIIEKLPTYVSHPFREPDTGNLELGHHGIDFSYYRKDGDGPIIDGVAVQAIMNGTIVALGFDRLPYGYMTMIETPYSQLPVELRDLYALLPDQSLYHLYAHMLEAPAFSIGDEVECAQTINYVGNSGFSGNPHLHLETRRGPVGAQFPAMIFYDTTATQEEMDVYAWWRTSTDFVKFDPLLLFATFKP